MPKRRRIEFLDGPGDYCSQCKGMMSFEGFVQLLSKDGFQHLSRQQCESTAATGCPLCMFFCGESTIMWKPGTVLVLSLSPGITDFGVLSGTPSEIVSALAQSRLACSNLKARSRPETGGQYHWQFSTKLFTTESDPAARFIVSRPVFGYADEDKLFTMARAWMEDCCRNHPGSCARNTKVALPTRLIDVGDEAIAPDVRLHISQANEVGEYMALSYCWGGEQTVVTTQDELDSMIQRVALSSLPRTIQDAVRVTRNMGQRYLWVDALCIVQDSEDDKRREIQQMGSIYKNAALTISAAAASDVSEGFLGRPPNPLPGCKWQFDIPSVGLHTIFISTRPETLLDYTPDHPLDRRGWALQESLLSPRLLVFSEQEPLWHCQAVQFKTAKDGYLNYDNNRKRLPDWVFTDSFRSKSWTTPKERRNLWTDIINNFTDRLLSDKEDRLNAVAGIAAELQRGWKDSYFFGHWEQGFVELLLWGCFRSPCTEERSSRAPTWSWASLNCPVRWEKVNKLEATAEVTGRNGGHRRVVLTCRTRTLEDVTRIKATTGYFYPSYIWDHADHASTMPPGAVLILLASAAPRRERVKVLGIIGIPTESSGGVQRVGLFQMWSLSKETKQTLWGDVKPEQVLLE